MEGCTLTDRGREVAWTIADCYVEVDIERRYASKEECVALAADRGFERIASGLSRDIYVPDPEYLTEPADVVVKIPTRLLGAYECRREARTWADAPDEARPFLAPVLDEDIGWELMPRAERELTSAETTWLWAGLSNAGWACEDANWKHNLGLVDGEPKILDYGGGLFPADDPAAMPSWGPDVSR